MNISELANYADVVGGIAVLISLIYVAIQIRQNTKMAQTSNYADLSFKVSEFNNLIASDSELADIYNRGIERFDNLSAVEKTRFNFAISRLMQAIQAMFHLRRRGYIDSELAQTNFDSIAVFLTAPGIEEWWSANRKWWECGFRDFMDGMIESNKPPSES